MSVSKQHKLKGQGGNNSQSPEKRPEGSKSEKYKINESE